MTRRSQRVQRIDDFAVEDQSFDPPALAFSKRALGRNADFVDAGTPRRRLDLVDEFRHVIGEFAAGQRQLGIDDEEQKTVVLDFALREASAGE